MIGMLKRRRRDGVGRNVRVCFLTTMIGTTPFQMREDATGFAEDAAPWCLRCVLCSFLLIETEAEIMTESFGTVLRLD